VEDLIYGAQNTSVQQLYTVSPDAPIVSSLQTTPFAYSDEQLPRRLRAVMRHARGLLDHAPATVDGLGVNGLPPMLSSAHTISDSAPSSSSRTGHARTVVSCLNIGHLLRHVGLCIEVATRQRGGIVLTAAAVGDDAASVEGPRFFLADCSGIHSAVAGEAALVALVAAEMAAAVEGLLSLTFVEPTFAFHTGAEAMGARVYGLLHHRTLTGHSAADLAAMAENPTAATAYDALRSLLAAPLTSSGAAAPKGIRKVSTNTRNFVPLPAHAYSAPSHQADAAFTPSMPLTRDAVADVVANIRRKVAGRVDAGTINALSRTSHGASPARDNRPTATIGSEAWSALLHKLQLSDGRVSAQVLATKELLRQRLTQIAVHSDAIEDDEALYELVEDAVANARRAAIDAERAESRAGWERLCPDTLPGDDGPEDQSPRPSPRPPAAPTKSALRKEEPPSSGARKVSTSRATKMKSLPSADDDEGYTMAAQRTLRAVFAAVLERLDIRLTAESSVHIGAEAGPHAIRDASLSVAARHHASVVLVPPSPLSSTPLPTVRVHSSTGAVVEVTAVSPHSWVIADAGPAAVFETLDAALATASMESATHHELHVLDGPRVSLDASTHPDDRTLHSAVPPSNPLAAQKPPLEKPATIDDLVTGWNRRRAGQDAALQHLVTQVTVERQHRTQQTASLRRRIAEGERFDVVDGDAVLERLEAEYRGRWAGIGPAHSPSSSDSDGEAAPRHRQTAPAPRGSIAGVMDRLFPARRVSHQAAEARQVGSMGAGARKIRAVVAAAAKFRSLSSGGGPSSGGGVSATPRRRSSSAAPLSAAWQLPSEEVIAYRLQTGGTTSTSAGDVTLVPYSESSLHDYYLRAPGAMPLRAFIATDTDDDMLRMNAHDIQYEVIGAPSGRHAVTLADDTNTADESLSQGLSSSSVEPCYCGRTVGRGGQPPSHADWPALDDPAAVAGMFDSAAVAPEGRLRADVFARRGLPREAGTAAVGEARRASASAGAVG
jgi:hypothetical protein